MQKKGVGFIIKLAESFHVVYIGEFKVCGFVSFGTHTWVVAGLRT